jgi:hypothetical protein
MCDVLLPPGVNPTAVNIYIYINYRDILPDNLHHSSHILFCIMGSSAAFVGIPVFYELVSMHCSLVYSMTLDMIYLLTATGLTPGGGSTVHIYTQTVHRKKQ